MYILIKNGKLPFAHDSSVAVAPSSSHSLGAYNSVFAVCFAHPNAFSTSQTRKLLSENFLPKIVRG
jgi:hypothetical protein